METLDKVVSRLLTIDGLGEAEYTRAYHIGVMGLEDLSLDLPLTETTTAPLQFSLDGTGIVPEGCLKVLRVARQIDGQLVSLTRNKDLNKLRCYNNNYHKHRVNVVGHDSYTAVNGGYYNQSLGVGSWNNWGEYFIDSNNIIYVSDDLVGCGDIYIEYRMLPSNEEGDFYVHPFIQSALVAYIRWTMSINRKNQSPWDKQYFQKIYETEKGKAKFRLKAPTKSEMNQSARQNTKFGLKS